MLAHIKKWSYNKKLRERVPKVRDRDVNQFNLGKKIGILYELENLDDHTTIHELKQTLKSDGRVVKTLSYIDQKIDVSSLAQKTFSRNEIKWDGIPESNYVDEFLNWDTDILICPIKVMRDCYSYIIQLSGARFKVGLNCEGAEELYDLIIDMPYVRSLDEILNEILNQLKTVSH